MSKQKEDDFKNVYRLGYVSFFTDFSSEMVLSILPVYILSLPGGSIAALGLIEGIAESLSYILRAVSGVMSDKFRKRKLFILLGYGISNIVKPFFAATTTVTQIIAITIALHSAPKLTINHIALGKDAIIPTITITAN